MKVLKNKVAWGLGLIIILQTLVYILAGDAKVYIHMDEAYSLGLAQYDKFSVEDNEDFYNRWHTRGYFQDYLAVQEKDQSVWSPVYGNQKNDVHPPLYYLLLRGVMGMVPGEFSKWPGIILNIVIAIPITILLYLITRRLLGEVKFVREKALGLTLVAVLTVAAISGVMYIRMYLLVTLWVLLTAWLHLKLIGSQEKLVGKWCALIGLVALAGVLTQYYYLFFLAGAVIVMGAYYIRNKKWRELKWYLGSLIVAGVTSLVIWPWSIQHMFFDYRGQGVIRTLLNVPKLLGNLMNYVLLVDYNVFHRTLALLLIVGVVCWAICKLSKNYCSARTYKMSRVQVQSWNVVLWPTVVYFGIVAAVSPYIELRYIMPVCGLILILVSTGVGRAVGLVWKEKAKDIIMIGLSVLLLAAAPLQIGLGWMRIELLYRDRATVMEFAETHKDTPVLYFITTENNRFLDNILPFATFEESYLALDLPDDEKEVKEILKGKDLEKGLAIFISDRLDQEQYLEVTKAAAGKKNVDFVQVVNTCSVYFLY